MDTRFVDDAEEIPMSFTADQAPEPERRRPLTLPDLRVAKAEGRPLVMVTAYDHPSARAAERAGVDLVLVGDSGAMTVLGQDSTVGVSLDEMIMLARATRRGLVTPLLVVDVPFGSFEASDELAVTTAVRLMRETGCDAVKIEGANETVRRRIRAVIAAGVPVVGHVGLTPQTAGALGGFKAQGRTRAAGRAIVDAVAALEADGCVAVVLEAVPDEVAEAVAARCEVVTIGIGAGPATDGQVLVFHDLLGIREGKGAKFVRQYAHLLDAMTEGVAAWAADVRSRAYPAPEHSYRMAAGETLDLGSDE